MENFPPVNGNFPPKDIFNYLCPPTMDSPLPRRKIVFFKDTFVFLLRRVPLSAHPHMHRLVGKGGYKVVGEKLSLKYEVHCDCFHVLDGSFCHETTLYRWYWRSKNWLSQRTKGMWETSTGWRRCRHRLWRWGLLMSICETQHLYFEDTLKTALRYLLSQRQPMSSRLASLMWSEAGVWGY